MLTRQFQISVHGHRGSRGTHPENTIAAFEEALDAGCDYFELDVQLSADQVPVVFHDEMVSSRICTASNNKPLNVAIPVRGLTVAVLKTYEIGMTSQPGFPSQKPAPGSKIQTLEEVLKWIKRKKSNTKINIEVKVFSNDKTLDRKVYAKTILDIISLERMQSRIMLQSFDEALIDQLRILEPDIDYSYLYENEIDFAYRASKKNAKTVGPFFKLVTQDSIMQCHKLGISILPWTVNNPIDWLQLISWGVDGLITDYPRALIDHLKGRLISES